MSETPSTNDERARPSSDPSSTWQLGPTGTSDNAAVMVVSVTQDHPHNAAMMRVRTCRDDRFRRGTCAAKNPTWCGKPPWARGSVAGESTGLDLRGLLSGRARPETVNYRFRYVSHSPAAILEKWPARVAIVPATGGTCCRRVQTAAVPRDTPMCLGENDPASP